MDPFEFLPQMLILAFILLKGKKVHILDLLFSYFGALTKKCVHACLKMQMPYLFVAFEIGMNVKNVYGVLVFTTSK